MRKKVCFGEYSIYYENKNGTWEGHFGSDSILFLKSQKVQWDIKASQANHVIQIPTCFSTLRFSYWNSRFLGYFNCIWVWKHLIFGYNPKFLKYCQFLFLMMTVIFNVYVREISGKSWLNKISRSFEISCHVGISKDSKRGIDQSKSAIFDFLIWVSARVIYNFKNLFLNQLFLDQKTLRDWKIGPINR